MGEERLIRARLALPKRDEAAARNMADLLTELGFGVVRVSKRGVGFEGPKSLFEEVFRCPVGTTPRGHAFDGEPELPEQVKELGGTVYFPTKPDHA